MMQTKNCLWTFLLVLVSLLGLTNCTPTSRPTESAIQASSAQRQDRNLALDKGVECAAPEVIDGKLDTIGQAEFFGWEEEIRESEEGAEEEKILDRIRWMTRQRLSNKKKSEPPPRRSLGSGFVITLPEEKPLAKIVIHAPALETGWVEVETPPGVWKKIRDIENNMNSPIVIRGFSIPRAKRVRLVVQSVYKGVQEIELYGPDQNALPMAQRTASENPTDPIAHRALGRGYLDSRRFQDAITSLSQAIRLQADYPEAYIDLGVALRRSGKAQQAIEAFREALILNNALPDAHFQLAVTYETVEQPLKAIFALERVMKLRPKDTEASAMLERLDTRRPIFPGGHLPKSELPPAFFVGMSEREVIEKYGEPDRILPISNLFGVTKRVGYGDSLASASGSGRWTTIEGSEFILGEAGVLGFHKVYSGDITALAGTSSNFPALVDEIPEPLQAIHCHVFNEQIAEKYNAIVQTAQIVWELNAESWLVSVYTVYPIGDFRVRRSINTHKPKLKDYRIMELWVITRDAALSIGLE